MNITFFVILALLVYVIFSNKKSENFEIEGFAEKHHHHAHHKHHGHTHHKHHAHHAAVHKIEAKPEVEAKPEMPVGPQDLTVGSLVSNKGIHSSGVVPIILGDEKNNQFVMHTPQDGRKQLWISPIKADHSDWDWNYSLSMDAANRTVSTNGNQLQLPNDFMPRGDADGWLRLMGHDGKAYKKFAAQQVYADQGVFSGGCDFVVGQNCGRGDSGASRALVKDSGPQLVINYANDFKAGTRVDGDLHVNKLWLGDRWSLEPEGNVLVFRDNKSGGDNRYAMFPGQGNGKNL
jgi:hypothetical protein